MKIWIFHLERQDNLWCVCVFFFLLLHPYLSRPPKPVTGCSFIFKAGAFCCTRHSPHTNTHTGRHKQYTFTFHSQIVSVFCAVAHDGIWNWKQNMSCVCMYVGDDDLKSFQLWIMAWPHSNLKWCDAHKTLSPFKTPKMNQRNVQRQTVNVHEKKKKYNAVDIPWEKD